MTAICTAALGFPLACASRVATFQYHRAPCANRDALFAGDARDLSTGQILPKFSTIPSGDGLSAWFQNDCCAIHVRVAYMMLLASELVWH